MASLLSFPLSKPSHITRAAVATSTASPSTSLVESLDEKFGRKGIRFSTDFDDTPIAELSVRNGSSVKLRLADAHVTSYKPKVYWKDEGFEEVMYTIPGSGGKGWRGGIGLVINEANNTNTKGKAESLLAGSEWFVKHSDSDSFDAVQVELGCKSGTLDMTYVVSLYPLSIATAIIVQNTGSKPVNLTTAILTHFKFKKRSGAGATDLRGCSYCSHPPLPSPFEILSPFEAMKVEDPGWFSFGSGQATKLGEWIEQDELVTVLRHKMSRVYGVHPEERSKEFCRTLPSKYEMIDQGRELFFRVIRMGFQEIYLSSPGSLYDKYGQEYFVCTGPASMLAPVTVNPGDEWRGAQVIEHDNL